jgi:hypothetical protein
MQIACIVQWQVFYVYACAETERLNVQGCLANGGWHEPCARAVCACNVEGHTENHVTRFVEGLLDSAENVLL